MSEKFDKNLIQQIIDSNEFKGWLLSRRWFGDKSALSNLDFKIIVKYFEIVSERIFLTVITIEVGVYSKSYFLPLIYYHKIGDILEPRERTQKNIVKLTENTFSKMLIRSIPDEQQGDVFPVNLVEGEHCLFFWRKMLFDKKISEFFPTFSLELTLYTEQFQEEINMAKVQTLIEASLYPDRYELSLEQLGGGNTTNLLFLLYIKNVNKPDQNPHSFVIKSYKEYSESLEPKTLFVLVKNNYPNAPKIYGTLNFHDKDIIGILEDVPNVGNLGDIYWNDLNRMVVSVFENFDEDFSYLSDKKEASSVIKDYCEESLRVSELIGLRIGELHKALILEKDDQYNKEVVDSEDYLKNYTSKLNKMVSTIQRSMNERAGTAFYNSPKISSILIDIKDIIEKFRLEFTIEKIEIQPVHQDLHMQQILYSKSNEHYNFYFIDFEGDPQLSLSEKKARFPIEKDIASFLRSLSYIKLNTLLKFIEEKIVEQARFEVPEEFLFSVFFRRSSKITEKQKVLESVLNLLNRWERELIVKILDKKLELHYTLITYFYIERVFHELDYELLYRPNKIIIPILGLKEIVDKD